MVIPMPNFSPSQVPLVLDSDRKHEDYIAAHQRGDPKKIPAAQAAWLEAAARDPRLRLPVSIAG
jgi:hypothetical protein